MHNNLFIISGPSGAGEDSVIAGLEKIIPLERVISTTTRPPRSHESNKNPYYFIPQKKFKEGIKKNLFFEWAREYNNHYYGVTRKEMHRIRGSKKIGIWKIEYQGVITAKKLIPGIKAILINAPLPVLKKRIKSRDNVSAKYLRSRMAYTKKWLQYKNIYDYEVINEENKLNKTIRRVAAIIKSQIDKK